MATSTYKVGLLILVLYPDLNNSYRRMFCRACESPSAVYNIISQTEVQWKGITLEELPTSSRCPLYQVNSDYCFTSLSAQSWQYRDRKKPESGTMHYSSQMTSRVHNWTCIVYFICSHICISDTLVNMLACRGDISWKCSCT